MSARRVLITGGTGFLGSALVRQLVREGRRVRVLDNDFRGHAHRLADVAKDVELVQADIRDARAVLRATEGVDTVCHLAFVNGTEFFYSQPELVLDVGVKGMVNVLDACIACGVRDLMVMSSSEVYQNPPSTPTDETVPLVIPDPLNPRYSYAAGKLISEIMTINYGRKHFDRAVIVRPHNVWGADMGWEHVIPQLATRMAELVKQGGGEPLPFPIQGDGKQTRAFVYIDDFTDGLVRVIDKGEHLGIYHVGTSEEITIETLVHEIARCLGCTVHIVPGPEPAGGTPRRCPDISKVRALGYEPRHSLASALPAVVEWYRANAHRR